MPTSFDVALTQLSFLEFVQRCNVLATPSQSTQLPSLSITCRRCCADRRANVKFLRTLPPRRRTSLVPRYLLTWLSRRLPAVRAPHSWMPLCKRHHTVLFPKTYSTQIGSRTVSSFLVDAALQTSTHSVVLHDAATQLDLTEVPHWLDFLRQSSGSSTSFLSVPAISAGLTCGTSAAAWT